jgi:Ca-activated chloride channel family protein
MKLRFLGTFLLFCIFSVAAQAQGIIVPSECRRCPPIHPVPPPRPLPRALDVKSIKISTRIDAQVATTKVEQVFENTTPYRLEGSYFFPIPESASVSDFAIYDGSKRMAGEVIERGKARQIYNEIVRKMIDPGLLEYVGKDLFQANVFPIEPRSTRKIELTYTQVLKNEGGTVFYRYELGSGRRILNRPASEISVSVEISSPIDLKNIYSPSHRISLKRDGEQKARLSFEGNGQEAQKDFLLYYSLSEKEFGLSLLSYKEPGKDGYFLMLLSPKVEVADQDRLAKDVVFVFDTSGSMSGEKLEKAKAALRFGVESLSPRDRFNIISFSGEERLMREGLTEASREALRESATFIDRLRAEGGTNINDALVAALKQFTSSDRSGMIVFLTDGLPTVGTSDAGQIVKNISEANKAGVRLFSFSTSSPPTIAARAITSSRRKTLRSKSRTSSRESTTRCSRISSWNSGASTRSWSTPGPCPTCSKARRSASSAGTGTLSNPRR